MFWKKKESKGEYYPSEYNNLTLINDIIYGIIRERLRSMQAETKKMTDLVYSRKHITYDDVSHKIREIQNRTEEKLDDIRQRTHAAAHRIMYGK
ncbi:MAG: hypothetical protein QS98_C0007G0020 [archaeon GW2011_AR3]|nr:MAG: hypothetical protein QS98_C0007G0020 [archaeon GW2011_AR3]MBS3108931.1 hypothetical protein [Candidatus Woesearchaeota archaeon]